jgi:hypothetical protein
MVSKYSMLMLFITAIMANKQLCAAGKINISATYNNVSLSNSSMNGERITIQQLNVIQGPTTIQSTFCMINTAQVQPGGTLIITGWDKKKIAVTTAAAVSTFIVGYAVARLMR